MAAADGYEIVNENGHVLKVVRAQQPVSTDSQQSKQGQYLLPSYSGVTEITQRKERKLALLGWDIQNLQNNLNTLVVREETLLSEAASSEMAGKAAASGLVQQIDRAQLDRAEMQKMLVDRQHDLGVIEALYRSYEVRLSQLLADQ